ncbi:MAG: hypothetical protein K6C94_08640, partial [Candidatus Gastranaerophilales bacterium]|nr:hypothetical protein [Candidatus Gastranaerophilales bacterium]
MPQENVVVYNPSEEQEDELNINVKKIVMLFWSRKDILLKVFVGVLLFFIILTFILPKKYVVSTDLYINKLNNSNIADINPYVLNETSGSLVSMGSDKTMNNEIELMKSALVLDKVIRDNNLKYKKGKRKGEYITAKSFYGKGKKLKIESVKNTNVISVSYKSGDPELSYNIVESFIKNYIELHKELNTIKAQKDKELIESEYLEAKEALIAKISQSKGLPVEFMRGDNRIITMYGYSKSAANAINNMRSQYLAGAESSIGIDKEAEKLKKLAARLEWADMVEQLSDTSKVIVLNEPRKLLPSENNSPKLLINIIIGCIAGFLAAIIAVVITDVKDEKLSYSAVSDNMFFDGEKNTNIIKTKILSYSPQKILIILLAKMSDEAINQLAGMQNVELVYPSMSQEFIDKISSSDKIMIVSKIAETKKETYQLIREMMKNKNKEL